MKKSILLSAVSVAACLSLAFYIIFGERETYGQAPQSESKRLVTRSVDSAPVVKRSNSAFAFAASRNEMLRGSLEWTFAGRRQKGWNIYIPLISHTIGTDQEPDSPEFAEALAEWQERNGLRPAGILDGATLQSMIGYWQAQRRFGSMASANLISAPISEFFDPSRGEELRKLESETYAAYRRMIAAAATDLAPAIRFSRSGDLEESEKFLKIVSAYRSPEYQAALRRREPNAGRGALAKVSVHSTGRALDIYVGGEPVTTKDPNRLLQVQTPAYRWLVKNAAKFGFYPYFYEPWHWEYVPGR